MKTKTLGIAIAAVIIIVVVAVVAYIVSTMPPAGTPVTGNAQVGATLYAQNCAGCHGPLESSTRRGRTAEQITNAIQGVPVMNQRLSNLTQEQIRDIAAALAQP